MPFVLRKRSVASRCLALGLGHAFVPSRVSIWSSVAHHGVRRQSNCSNSALLHEGGERAAYPKVLFEFSVVRHRLHLRTVMFSTRSNFSSVLVPLCNKNWATPCVRFPIAGLLSNLQEACQSERLIPIPTCCSFPVSSENIALSITLAAHDSGAGQ